MAGVTRDPQTSGSSQPESANSDGGRRRLRKMLGSPWFHLAAAFVLMGLVLSLVAKPYVVPSSSMEDTLHPGDRVLVFRLAYVGSEPETGDVIVFDADDTWGAAAGTSTNPVLGVLRWVGEWTGFGRSGDHTLIKRVIAGPGQTAACCSVDGRVTVGGVPLDEPYVKNNFPFVAGKLDCNSTPRSRRCFDQVIVPADSFLVLGDNRANSSDSAYECRVEGAGPGCWRWAKRDDIVGQAVAVIWPVGAWRGL